MKLMRFGVVAGALAAFGAARAADVTGYSVGKGQVFTQTGASAPAAAGFVFRAVVEGDVNAITLPLVQPPSGFSFEVPLNDDGTRFEFEQMLPDLQTLQLIFGSGNFNFTIDTETDIELAQLELNNTTFPTAIPQISNFTDAQSVNAAANFTLTFNSLGDAQRFRLVITGDDGEVLVEEGTGTGVTIPAGTLATDSSYSARLSFIKELDRDTTSVVGATGTAELYNQTEFSLETGAGGGNPGGGDTTPPFLFSTTPVNGATGVGVNSTLTFNFSEAMAAAQSIEWSANVNPASFTYAWTGAGRTLVATYTGNLPASANITWRLNPNAGGASNFKDLAGNELPPGIFQGSFTTGSGTTDPNDPCNPNPVDDGRGFGAISKMANYVQTGNNNPVPDPELAAMFSGSYKAASNHTVTSVTLSGPAGNKTFQNLFGHFLLNEQFVSAAAVDAAYPAGSYTITATGAGSASVTLGNVANVPVPKINNLTELGSMNVASPFTLQFSPFAGVTANDSIFISIFETDGGGQFTAPDLCKNILLPNTASSVTIPANTFAAGKRFNGSITFSRSGSFNTNAIAGTAVSAGVSATTNFEFTTGGGNPPPTQPRWTTIRRNANGTLTFVLTGTAGTNVAIEGTGNLTAWSNETSATIAANGTYEFTVNPALQRNRAYRARVQ